MKKINFIAMLILSLVVGKDATEKNIDISYYPNGFYKVALVTDGQIVDVKILSKW